MNTGYSAVSFHFGFGLFVPALLPGFKLCHDRVFSPHDMERLNCSHGQRESHRGGAEVRPDPGPHPIALIPCALCDSREFIFYWDKLLKLLY